MSAPLRDDAVDGAGEQVRLDVHIQQTGDCAGGVIGVQRRKHQVTGESSLHRDARGFLVANLADHDDVRVLTQNAPQRTRE